MISLNTKSVGAAGAAMVLASFLTLGKLLTDTQFLFNFAYAVYRVTRHLGSPDDARTFATFIAPLLGMLLGAVGAYFGRPVTVKDAPPSSPGPDSGASASSDANLKLAA